MRRTTEQPLVGLAPGEYRGPYPFTSEQLAAITASEKRTRDRRIAAVYRRLDLNEKIVDGARNCTRCVHLGSVNAEHGRGYCMELRFMRSTRFPVLCNAYKEG